MYIYKNFYKDYNEKLWKLDLCTRKSDTENEPEKHHQLSSVCSARGKTSLGEGKQEVLGCEISREKSIIHSTDIYLVPTISTKRDTVVSKPYKVPVVMETACY